jgi:hypothetical protein
MIVREDLVMAEARKLASSEPRRRHDRSVTAAQVRI